MCMRDRAPGTAERSPREVHVTCVQNPDTGQFAFEQLIANFNFFLIGVNRAQLV